MNGYNQSPFANITPVVKNLLIINILFFIGDITIGKYFPKVMQVLPVYYFNSPFFRPWEIITYMFMHGGFAHIFFNMFALFSFGPILEYSMGQKKFFNLFFLCGIGGVLCNFAVQAYEVHAITGAFTISHPELQETFDQYHGAGEKLAAIYYGQTVGASGAIFGLLVAFGMMYPNLELMIMFIPVPIKAKYIIPVYIVIELFLGYQQYSWDNTAHFAHLGGALIGYLLVKIWKLQNSGNY
ncbi:rhomboid family intramembrane serine protease [Mucilaginibacter flavus]|uniref:rhomboid family intramembrane serine protease n=1 Tax=Mucilaginibacter flavus TaxID=931504 RepID=UPI0025B36BF4|nr:rhomboid family intramembrane serine protease [Mucilaginibacter flavus]MDN3582268.1 rhomboid family intramembrane serine protease [Mucilaginibacter flavus]